MGRKRTLRLDVRFRQERSFAVTSVDRFQQGITLLEAVRLIRISPEKKPSKTSWNLSLNSISSSGVRFSTSKTSLLSKCAEIDMKVELKMRKTLQRSSESWSLAETS
jgi:hypothetical protein